MDCWTLLNVVGGKSKRTLLYGPPGTGKTTAACRMGDPGSFYSLSLSDGSTEAELRGHYIPTDGKFVWHDGPALRAWREGVRLVVNEIDHAPAEVLSFLHAILDDPEVARITLPTGETVTPAEGFHVIATMNGEPNDLPPALRDRFPVCLEVDRPHPEAIEALPANLRKAATDTAVHDDPERRVSTRAWAAYAALVADGIPEDAAALAVFGARGRDVLDSLRIGSA